MPAKKKQTPVELPQVQEGETQTAPPAQQDDVNQRLARIEAAIEKMAAGPAPRIPSPTIMTTRGRAKRTNTAPANNRRSFSADSEPARPRNRNSQSSSSIDKAHANRQRTNVNKNAHNDVTPTPTDQPTRHNVQHDPVVAQLGDPLAEVNKLPSADQLIDVNMSQPWANWATLPDNNNSVFQANVAAPASNISNYGFHQDDVEQRVQHILASTASTLSRGNVKPGAYPFKYVRRGTERQNVSINSVSLSEHLWGLVCMIRDPKIDPSIRPSLNSHMLEVIEDSCDFEWDGVRRWSEEIFTLVAENRLPGGWSTTSRIQMLRLTVSRSPSNCAYPPRENNNLRDHSKHQYSHQQHQHQFATAEAPKTGPPCTAYNSPSGCPLPAGHIINGRKVQHVCTFCLYNSCAAYTHSEFQCRNKNRYPPPHHF